MRLIGVCRRRSRTVVPLVTLSFCLLSDNFVDEARMSGLLPIFSDRGGPLGHYVRLSSRAPPLRSLCYRDDAGVDRY